MKKRRESPDAGQLRPVTRSICHTVAGAVLVVLPYLRQSRSAIISSARWLLGDWLHTQGRALPRGSPGSPLPELPPSPSRLRSASAPTSPVSKRPPTRERRMHTRRARQPYSLPRAQPDGGAWSRKQTEASIDAGYAGWRRKNGVERRGGARHWRYPAEAARGHRSELRPRPRRAGWLYRTWSCNTASAL